MSNGEWERSEQRLERFCAAPDGAFVWTRDEDGFHLGQLTGPCRHDDGPEAIEADLVHVRGCEWLPVVVDVALVPDQVRYAFSRGGRNFQRIGIDGAGAATEQVWSQLV